MATTMESTARFGAGEVAVTFPTSQYGEVSRSIAFCAPIQLGESDLVAALWLVSGNWTWDELSEVATDPARVRHMVAETLVNEGLESVDQARCEVACAKPGTREHAWAVQLHAVARTAFASVLPGQSPRLLAGAV